jgi:hypothetical protein
VAKLRDKLKKHEKMKKSILLFTLITTIFQFNNYGQEQYGYTLNLGMGIGGHYGYYRYVGNSLPDFHIDYEIAVANNFTLAPSLNIHTYSKQYNRETGLGIGVKGFYYFDNIEKAGSKWGFYLGGTIGFVTLNSRWDANYQGDRHYNHPAPHFLDFHLGTEYHVNSRLGVFLDLSSGISTFEIAIHG